VILEGLLDLIGGILGVLKTVGFGVAMGALGWSIVGIMGSAVMGIMGSPMGGAMRSGLWGICRGVVWGRVSVDRGWGVSRLMVGRWSVSIWRRGWGVGSMGIRCRGVRGLMVRCGRGVMRSIRVGSCMRGTKIGISLGLGIGQGNCDDSGDNLKKRRFIANQFIIVVRLNAVRNSLIC
jgi:hypothetical protein